MNVPSKSLTLPAIPIRDMVLFPGSRLPFMVGRRSSVRTMELAIKAGDHLVMLTQRDPKEEEPKQESLYSMGTLALVESLIPVPKDHYKVGVRGIARVKLERYLDEGDVVQAEVTILAEPSSPESALLPTFNQAVQALLLRNPELARSFSMESLQELPLGGAIDAVAGALPVEVREKQQVLDQLELEPRLHTLLRMLELDAARHRLEGDAEDKTRQSRGSEHRPFVLGEKMGGAQASGRKGEKDEISRLRDQILKVEMGEEAEKKALEELDRLESMAPQSAESTVSRSYIEWLLALPWNVYADEHLDLEEAERILDEDHSGLEKVKVRILEYLAVMRRLRDSSSQRGSAGLRGPILCLVGPPGVGKTSLARSIARALNRPFLRFSLGGLRDEAEIRGHRRTYIGSMPGRIISLMKKGAVRNPVMLLDEIDKMGADWRGDPSSALLEVLDPEQNFSFQDHYLDVGFDLSQVLFLATANVRHQIPQPLEDRLEVLELSSYTLREKRAIAQAHLVPKALERHGMENMDIRFEDAAIDKIIQDYTKEAGVRQLEREISGVLRKLARQSLQPAANGSPGFDGRVSAERLPKLLGPEIFLEAPLGRQQPPGVVHGLAWTPFGGDLLTIEAAKLPGKGNLRLTGKLGEVMQESANLALSFVRMRSESLGLKPDFMEQVDLHVHLPEGAIPKDGPSAG
ncbi:MAG: endopeptidase La, partial [Holophaga sp.]|nr:endopeptidase La [Holophaga sp.]